MSDFDISETCIDMISKIEESEERLACATTVYLFTVYGEGRSIEDAVRVLKGCHEFHMARVNERSK